MMRRKRSRYIQRCANFLSASIDTLKAHKQMDEYKVCMCTQVYACSTPSPQGQIYNLTTLQPAVQQMQFQKVLILNEKNLTNSVPADAPDNLTCVANKIHSRISASIQATKKQMSVCVRHQFLSIFASLACRTQFINGRFARDSHDVAHLNVHVPPICSPF